MREAREEIMNVERDEEEGEGEEGEWMTAWDDVKGRELDPRRVLQARAEEIEYIHKMKLYRKVPKALCKEVLGKVPIRTTCIDTN